MLKKYNNWLTLKSQLLDSTYHITNKRYGILFGINGVTHINN